MKVLHITNWYPNAQNPREALWIRRHIDALQKECENEVFHVQVESGKPSFSFGRSTIAHRLFYLRLPLTIWRLKEWLSALLVLWIILFHARKKQYELINFHIAYPLCVYIKWFKGLLNKPFVITEHWSAYHLNFNITKAEKLKRIQQIFHHQVPVITVSEALAEDIQRFSATVDFPYEIVPNIVDTEVFNYQEIKEPVAQTLFMVSQWKEPKDPFTALKAFKQLLNDQPELRLRIGGYGPQQAELEEFVRTLNLQESVTFLGPLTKGQIAQEMRSALAFVHSSKYETFSVVCAEAVCCGTPVIASKVGGIPSFITNKNGILVNAQQVEEWEQAMSRMLQHHIHFKREEIARQAAAVFSEKQVGKKYFEVLNKYLQN